MQKLPLSVVILTCNEVDNLTACLDSLATVTDDVHVVDSGSTDGTVALAQQRGVAVQCHSFEGFGSQRNWAIDHLDHQYPWVFHLDADEQFTPELAAEIESVLQRNDSTVGYYVANRLMLGGRWLRYAGNYPTYQLRLFRWDAVRFENHGHGQREVTEGPLGYLRQPYVHYGFSKGMEAWFRKHAGYARDEARQAVAQQRPLVHEIVQCVARDRVVRRRAWKAVSYRLPMRSALRWLHTMVLKRGLLDGRAGWTYARMLAIYEAMIAVEIEAVRQTQGRF